MKIRLFILVLLFMSLCPNCNAITTKIPQNTIEITQQTETQVEKSIFDMVCSFFGGVFKRISGQASNEPLVKSEDIENLSNTIKTYQKEEEQNNSNYKDSNAKDNADFGIGMLDLFAGILKFFGI